MNLIRFFFQLLHPSLLYKQAETSVQPKRQKLLNVKLGPKLADDTVKLSSVKLPKVVMMMGSTEAKISEIEVAAEAAPEVLDDFDVGVNEEVSLLPSTKSSFPCRN